jgi:hypothetical protein
MKHLHKKDRALFRFVQEVMFDYSHKLAAPLVSVKPLEKEKCARYFGRCSRRGNIHLRVRNVKRGEWAGRDEAYQIIDTMAHEMAHLWSQEHGALWFAHHVMVLAAFSRDGIYKQIKEL